ncbi:MAG: TonB-dependent receptor [Gemmatimonadota bacterium]
MIKTFSRISLVASLLLVLTSASGAAQQSTGRIIGRVVDAATARPLVGAQVYVNDGVVGTLSDLNGRYVLTGVPVGQVEVTVQQLGYGTKTVTGVSVNADEVTALDITLEESAVEIEGLTVSAEREAGSTASLLDERRTSTAMVEAVGAEEISRRPDSDAAEVAQRMSGVTVTDGKYVFVRGLGERYSQTSLNGSSLPSPEPEREVVPLDLFPSGFLESLQTQKTYTPDLPADFSGGSVQIRTKNFPSRFTFRVGVETSFNSLSQFNDDFLSYGGGGLDWLGLDNGYREQPAVVQDLMGDVFSGQRLPSDPAARVAVGEGYQALEPSFTPGLGSTPLNRSFNVSLGGRADAGRDGEIGYFLAGTYSDNYTIRGGNCLNNSGNPVNLLSPSGDFMSGQERIDTSSCNEFERKWRTSAFDADAAQFETPNVDYAFQRGSRAVNWGTIGNFTWRPGTGQQLSLRTTANLSTDDEARLFLGNNDEDIGGVIQSERSRWVERLMLWGQLSGEHQLFADSRLDWRFTMARANRQEPLLRETIYLQDPVNLGFYLLDFTESGRYFDSELIDDDMSVEFDWRFPFQLFGNDAAVKFGAAYRNRDREFGARRLNWRFQGNRVQDLDSELEAGTVVPTRPTSPDEFQIGEVVEPGDLYNADDERIAGYLMVEVPVTSRLQAVVGARVEDYNLGLNSRGDQLQDLRQTDMSPSLNLIYSAADNIKIRASASRTLDRPEFRELAPFQFTEATSLRQLFGNPDLGVATIVSGDLRAEWFPRPGEVISVGGFYKDLQDPIEQVFIAAGSSAFSFQNAEEAQVLGIEVDVQLGLDRFSRYLEGFSFQGNYSWIDSEVTVRPGGIFIPTELQRPLEGQAPYVVNLGLNYASFGGFQAGVFFNRFGTRINAAGGSGIPDIEEQPRNVLDATVGFPLFRGLQAKIKATNLLDAEYLFTQSLNGITRTQRSYVVGRTFSVGLSWEF